MVYNLSLLSVLQKTVCRKLELCGVIHKIYVQIYFHLYKTSQNVTPCSLAHRNQRFREPLAPIVRGSYFEHGVIVLMKRIGTRLPNYAATFPGRQ